MADNVATGEHVTVFVHQEGCSLSGVPVDSLAVRLEPVLDQKERHRSRILVGVALQLDFHVFSTAVLRQPYQEPHKKKENHNRSERPESFWGLWISLADVTEAPGTGWESAGSTSPESTGWRL